MAKPDKIKGQQDRILVIDDEKHRALDLSQMNILPPEVGIFDEPTRCYRINHEWAKIVMGIVGWLAEVAVWRDAQNEGYFAIEEILRFKQGVPCMDYQLRQNPTDACQLEQSFDGGDTWSLAFDYSLCQVGEDGAISIESLEQQLIRINERFDELTGDIPQLYPRLEYDMTSADNIRDLALCAAVNDLVDFICELVLEERENDALVARIGAIILGITSVALIASGIGSPLGLAIATLLVAGYATIWDGVSNAVLGDDDARELVACCMFDALSGTTVTQTSFQDSLDGCDFDELTNEAQIAGAIADMLDDDDIFQTFVEFWDEKYRPAELGLVTCDCLDPIVVSALQLTEQLLPAVIVNGVFNEVSFGVDHENISGSTLGCRVYLPIPVGATLIHAKMLYNVQSNVEARQNRILDGADGTGIILQEETPTGNTEHLNRVLEFDGSHVMTNDRVQFSIHAHIATGSYAGLKEIEISYLDP